MSEKESSCCKLPCGHCSCNAQVTPGWPCEICELEETVRQFEAQAQTAIELLSERNRELAELKQPAVVPKLKVGDEVYGIELTGRGGNTVIGPMLVVESKTLLRAKTKTGRTAFALIDEDAFATREEAEAECSRRNEEAGNEGD